MANPHARNDKQSQALVCWRAFFVWVILIATQVQRARVKRSGTDSTSNIALLMENHTYESSWKLGTCSCKYSVFLYHWRNCIHVQKSYLCSPAAITLRTNSHKVAQVFARGNVMLSGVQTAFVIHILRRVG